MYTLVESLYRHDLGHLPKRTEDDLVQAIEGNRQAQERIIHSLLPILLGYAMRLQNRSMDLMELVAVGNVTLVEKTEEAWQHPNPLGFLLKWAKMEMKQHRRLYHGPITLPSSPCEIYTFWRGIDEIDTDVFDIEGPAVLTTSPGEETPLYEALQEALPSKEARTFLMSLFGLDGLEPKTLSELVGSNSTTRAYRAAQNKKLSYFAKIRQYLAEQYPETYQDVPTNKDSSVQYDWVTFPPSTQTKLDAALQTLLEQGKTLSMNNLRKTSGVATVYASAYLAQLREQGLAPAAPQKRGRKKPVVKSHRPRNWRTRPDAFQEVWLWVDAQLEKNPHIQRTALFHQLCQEYPGQFQENQCHTFRTLIKRRQTRQN